MMKKHEVYEGIVRRVDFPNRGIVETADADEGLCRVQVKNVIPGQQIRYRLTKKRGEQRQGQLLEILRKSDIEAMAGCPHFTDCGGCIYQTVSGEEQRRIKEEQVKRLLEPVCPELHFEGVLPSPQQEEYRNKMEFTFGDVCKGGEFALGMHRRGGFYDIVNCDECRIVHADYRKILTATRSFFDDRHVPFYRKMQHMGYLRHLLVRRTHFTSEILVDLITSTQMEKKEEKKLLDDYTACLRALPLEGKLTGILHTANDAEADVVRDQGTEILYGEAVITEKLLGLQFHITPFSFFQTNSAGAEVLYGKVREYALPSGGDAPQTLFDLYSGTGTIAQILAPVAQKVVGVEIVPEAVEAARENASLNGLDNCSFLCGDVLKVVDELEEKPDLIILDPPRDGIHPRAIGKIIAFGVKRMVYVSCKPTSLARDLAVLIKAGYQVEKSCAVDMFPATGNIETVVLLKLEDL